MKPVSLRTLVSAIGLFVALTTAISLPVGYGLINYSADAERLTFQAKLDASRVARYIYQHGALWPYHRVRLDEVIELVSEEDQPLKQRIFKADGGLVLERGPTLAQPTFSRSTPILVSGTTAGRLEVEASARPLILNTAFVSLLSGLLGLFAYFGVRVLPLRVLDRTLGELQQREEQLRGTNEKFEAALANMPQGLAMFDANCRMILCNERYASLFRTPSYLTRPGTPLEKIAAYSASVGAGPSQIEPYLDNHRALAQRTITGDFETKLQDGRVIRVSHRPRTDGGFVASYEDITDNVRAHAQIAHMAHHDALTGLPNRVLFKKDLDIALSDVDGEASIAVLCLDLDRFKAVNDTLGHPVGDALLQEVGERVRSCLGAGDKAARLGGDEFAVVQTRVAQPLNGTALAERLIDELSRPYDLYGHQVVISASVGIALFPGDGDQAHHLLKSADMALYRAKADGRSTFRFFEQEMDEKLQLRRALELDLRGALANQEFEVHYQPLINVAEDRICGFEALLRWNHPERGRIPPADFIPLAEEIGVIGSIGAWVLRQACTDAATWPSDVRIAVNLSPAQFKTQTMVLDVLSALGSSGLSPERLELEITETVMLQDTESTLSTLLDLRALGVRISMDDFGTGYSSLSYLRKFPFDKIKIDQSFIRDLSQDQDAIAIVKAVMSLGASLGMSTTAEGVETEEQLERLRSEGCTEVQGWLFSPARPIKEIAELLSSMMMKRRAA